MPREHIGDRLKARRAGAGLTQKGFAARLGVPWRSYQDWEYNRSAVDSFKAAALLAAAKKIAMQGKAKKAKRRRGKK